MEIIHFLQILPPEIWFPPKLHHF